MPKAKKPARINKKAYLDELQKSMRAQDALCRLGLPDLSEADFDERLERMARKVNPDTTDVRMRPDICEGCDGMNLLEMKVSVGGRDGRHAWVCDDCGHAHLTCQHEADLSTARPADGANGVLDANCRHCGSSGSMAISAKDFVFD